MAKRYPLTTDDAASNAYYDDSAGEKAISLAGIFKESGNVIREVDTAYDNDFVVGSPQLADDGNAAHDNRMFFDKSKGAFRAGGVTGTQWNDVNVGVHSHAEGYINTASGGYSHAEGANNTASGEFSHAEGQVNTASGNYSHAEGYNTIASGDFSHAEGSFSTASGSNSHSGGEYSNARLFGAFTRTSGRLSIDDYAQYINITPFNQTTDATPTELFLDGLTATERMTLEPTSTWGFKAMITARQVGGTAGTNGDSHIFKIEGGIKRDGANNTTLIGAATVSTIVNDAGAAAWTIAVTADDTNEALKIEATGEADKTIDWIAKVELVEIVEAN